MLIEVVEEIVLSSLAVVRLCSCVEGNHVYLLLKVLTDDTRCWIMVFGRTPFGNS